MNHLADSTAGTAGAAGTAGTAVAWPLAAPQQSNVNIS